MYRTFAYLFEFYFAIKTNSQQDAFEARDRVVQHAKESTGIANERKLNIRVFVNVCGLASAISDTSTKPESPKLRDTEMVVFSVCYQA